jgi:hypothetical protein
MRSRDVLLPLLIAVASLGSTSAFAQNRRACELIAQADVEAIVGVKLMAPQSGAPFRSLLDEQDFGTGPPDTYCAYSNVDPRNMPSVKVFVPVEVRYTAAPDANAVAKTLKQIDERTYDKPTTIDGLGDAAFRTGGLVAPTLFVFLGGTTRLMIGPSEVGLDKELAIARKILANLGAPSAAGGPRASSAYAGTNRFPKPKLATGNTRVAQLERTLAPKAENGDVRAQLALAKVYRYGDVARSAAFTPDWPAAGYWYNEAANRGDAEASYELGLMLRDSTGVAADADGALELLRKAAEAGYVPAMVPLSILYAAARTAVSPQRATFWADQADQHGDPHGTYILGYEHSRGWLGGGESYAYAQAMEKYRKAADGGVCVAFDGIADLYAQGHGVPRDAGAARDWHARGNDCRARQVASLWDGTATLAAMSNATGIHGESPPSRPALGGADLTPAQKQFVVYASGFLALLALAHAFPGDPNAAADDGGYDPNAIIEMNRQVERELHEQDLIRQLVAPMPRF